MKTVSIQRFVATAMTLLVLSTAGVAAANEPDNTPSGGAVVATGCIECSINASSVPIDASKSRKSSDRYDAYLPTASGSSPGASGNSTDVTK